MSTPSERLQKIVNNIVPSKVKFSVEQRANGRLFLTPHTVERFKLLPNEDRLQEYLADILSENWDHNHGKFVPNANMCSLYINIKQTVINTYESVSDRCAATRRKTQAFIQGIKIEDALLANYLISVFLEIKSSWNQKSRTDQRIYLETLESLRRVYGSR